MVVNGKRLLADYCSWKQETIIICYPKVMTTSTKCIGVAPADNKSYLKTFYM